MNDESKFKWTKFAWTATPLALVLLCAVIYIIFDWSFIRCDDNDRQNGCDKIEADMISGVKNAEGRSTSYNRLTSLNTAIETLSNKRQEETNSIIALQANISEKTRSIDSRKIDEVTAEANTANAKAINANIKRLEAEKTQMNGELTLKQSNVNTYTAEIANKQNEEIAVRKQYAGRYSNRVLWLFLSALFVALTVGAVVAGSHIIFKSQRLFTEFETATEERKRKETEADARTGIWIGITATAAVLLLIIFNVFDTGFMSFTLSLLKQTLLKEGIDETSKTTIIFFGTLFLLGSAFLISASCLIFRTAIEVDAKIGQPDGIIISPPETVNDVKLRLYAKLLKYLRIILYAGTFMLFVGILRMSFLMKWHLTFVSNDSSNELYKLLDTFWQSSMTVQGGFYTIMLALIYLPAAYWINGKLSDLGKDQAELANAGVAVKYTDIIFKLLAIVSPLIATGLGGKDWLNFFNN